MQALIADIVNGERAPGEPLPNEAQLAEQFGVSRGTAREFIRGLEERGLITVKHGRGATVNSQEMWDTLDPEVLASLLAGPQSVPVLEDFLESRRLLEIEAAGLAAERADEEDLSRLQSALETMHAAADAASRTREGESRFHEADIRFHHLLVVATKNSTLTALASKIHGAMLEARYPLARPKLRAGRILPEHERILRAVGKGNAPAARRAMRDHLRSVEEFLEEYAQERGVARRFPG